MAQIRDLYEILGVPREASQEDIKKAYRRLAREHHPDVSQSHDAEDRFKEVAAAYEILSDPEKRQQYDRYGQAGGPMDFPFGDVADIFEAFFGSGGFGRGTTTRRSRVQRGAGRLHDGLADVRGGRVRHTSRSRARAPGGV